MSKNCYDSDIFGDTSAHFFLISFFTKLFSLEAFIQRTSHDFFGSL